MTRHQHSMATLLLLFCYLLPVSGQWNGCVDPKNPAASTKIRIGDPTTICLILGPSGHWSNGGDYIRYTFQPEADEYSKFHIPNSYQDLINNNNRNSNPFVGSNITVHVGSQLGLSVLRLFHYRFDDANRDIIYPFLTAIIDVDKGVVRGIAWDDACVFCAKSECDEISYNFNGDALIDINEPTRGCGIRVENCNKALLDNPEQCDVTLYVVWTGTDVDGRAFQSSIKRFSAFSPGSLQDRLTNLLPSIPNPFA